MKSKAFTNNLIKESSPYLLQHAHNPVNWHPWSPKILEQAQKEDKLLIISIGYSSCHWCHVMEEECFEDIEVARVMNAHYLNVKVDREEFPDVDQVYMNALQLMSGQGGWPLNIVALPDGRPVWGGTYLPKINWIEVLQQIDKIKNEQQEKLEEYASSVDKGVKAMGLVKLNPVEYDFEKFPLKNIIESWKGQLDKDLGGTKRAPKFMMPNNYRFLLRYAHQSNDKELLEHVNLTLTKIAYGGIFDHVNAGFSRYSVDEKWHIPHFEKMLYDNAQLVSLYSDAYKLTKNQLYKEVVYETLEFVKRELTHESGGFYSALDADSLNEYGVLEEGAYYVFTKAELENLLQEDFHLFSEYYNINDFGKWEGNNYVLIRNSSDEKICEKFNISEEALTEKKKSWKEILLQFRKGKQRPRLDTKILTSWNGLMLKGYVDAYSAFGKPEFLEAALKNGGFILGTQMQEDGSLFRNYTNEKSSIAGYLEDYAATIAAFISLYEITLDEKWVYASKKLTDYTFEYFFDEKNQMFLFTSKAQNVLTPTMEYRDNVIPASNSIHAHNLFWLGKFFNEEKYMKTSKQMLKNIIGEVETYPPAYSNWLDLLLNHIMPFYEIIVTGKSAPNEIVKLNKQYLPNVLIAGSTSENELPLFRDRFVDGKTVFYFCEKNNCKLPAYTITEVLKNLKNN